MFVIPAGGAFGSGIAKMKSAPFAPSKLDMSELKWKLKHVNNDSYPEILI